ncbi:MAG: transposase [Oscillospiraceae bacterium]|nr:transposase [Oscillospiraceae bacterium]
MKSSESLKFFLSRFGKCFGISFVDSAPIKVCDNHRISSHRVFSEYFLLFYNCNTK